MATKIQLRHDTATNWASANPILSVGEVGFETDTNKAKFGNGVTEYNELPYICEEIIKKYSELQDKPKINSIELVGDTSLDELNIQVKGDYATREDLTVALEPKANVSDLENYVQNEKLNEYATLVSVAESLELKADKESLGDYVLKEEMGEYVTPTTLAESLELKADKETTYTKEEVDALIPSEVVVPTKVSELENDLGFISAVAEEYITEEELTTTLESYVKKEEIELPTVPTKVSELENDSKFVTEEVLETKGYLTEHQDISGKADKTYVDEELGKKADVSSLPALSSLMNGEAPVIADIEATEVADLVTALNAILAQLRTRGVIA